jgi:hypothetical protein
MTSVSIPDSLTNIGYKAFFECRYLKIVAIPDSVTNIGSSAFESCSGLTEVHISDLAAWCTISFGSTNANPCCYAHRLFLNGEEITNLVIPDNVRGIGRYVFEGCSRITSLTIPDSVTNLPTSFESCDGLLDVVLGNGVITCPTFGKQLLSLSLGNGIVEISANQFCWYSSLTNISLGNNVRSIGDCAFYGCQGLRTITIPASVTSLGSYVFGENTVSTQSSICPLSTVYLMEGSPLTRGTLKAAGMRSAAKVRIRVSRNAYGAAWTF